MKQKSKTTGQEDLIKDDFLKWVKEKTHLKFGMYKPMGQQIIIRLYFFDASKYSKDRVKLYIDMDSDETAQDELQSQVFGIAKVLAVGEGVDGTYSKLKPGDLVTVQDDITTSQINKEWEEYHALLLEKPGMRDRIKEPPMYVGKLQKWSHMVFLQDKLCMAPTKEDAHTFIVDQRTILAKYEEA